MVSPTPHNQDHQPPQSSYWGKFMILHVFMWDISGGAKMNIMLPGKYLFPSRCCCSPPLPFLLFLFRNWTQTRSREPITYLPPPLDKLKEARVIIKPGTVACGNWSLLEVLSAEFSHDINGMHWWRERVTLRGILRPARGRPTAVH